MGGGKPFRKIQGGVYVIDGDEFVTESNPKGDEKIDQWGNLLGGRQFKASTFILPNRHPHRRYMLAIDAARTSGFRDSLYYFRRNLLAFKLNATQPEKDYLISEGKLGSHLRTRSVTLVTARSAFKLHGAKTILDGRWITDDYYEEKVLEDITAKGIKAGDLVGELPDPNAKAHTDDASALNAVAAGSSKTDRSGGGGGIYRAGGPTTIFGGSGWGPYSDGPLNAVRKSLLSRDGVAEENWMWMMSMRVLEADEEWAKWRKESLKVNGAESVAEAGPSGISEKPEFKQSGLRQDITKEEGEEQDVSGKGKGPAKPKRKRVTFESNPSPLGVYEPHSSLIHYRDDTQPTSSRWEVLPDSKRILGGTHAGNGAWALAWVDTVMELPAHDRPPSPASLERDRLMKEALATEPIDLTMGDSVP
ncbi:hypothetical protein BDN72DRAFT_757327 [Pluteus cervinus]|uniref:Uncharacterized protein n=1 Tax=Pluteus cervinus TaxID=181527 RepID=A0ACD3BCR5_9AGAR|nr:hypothetical protein BDN72DRAFT_757327 [Pluteus cervinus]